MSVVQVQVRHADVEVPLVMGGMPVDADYEIEVPEGTALVPLSSGYVAPSGPTEGVRQTRTLRLTYALVPEAHLLSLGG